MNSLSDSLFDDYTARLEQVRELNKRREEVQSREQLLGSFHGLISSVKSTDVESLKKPLEERLVEYYAKREALPKNWFGRVKDKRRYMELESQIDDIKRELESVPRTAQGYRVAADKIAHELSLPEGISYDEVRKAHDETKKTIQTLDEKIATAKPELRELSIRVYELTDAQSVFGDNLYGPYELYDRLSKLIKKEEMPALPDKTLMERAKDMGMVMALRVYGVAKPLLGFIYGRPQPDDEEQSKRKPEWKFFKTDFVSGTVYRSYIEQTQAIRNYLKNNGLLQNDEASECTDEKLQEIEQLAQTDQIQAVEKLTNLLINKRHRHSQSDVLYFDQLTRRPTTYEWVSVFKNRTAEATNSQSRYEGKKLPYFVIVNHFGDSRGLHTDRLPFNDYHGVDFGHQQGVRIVL